MRNRPNPDPNQNPLSAEKPLAVDQPLMAFDPLGHKDQATREAEARASGATHMHGGAPGVIAGAVAAPRAPSLPQTDQDKGPPVHRFLVPLGGTYVEGGNRVQLRPGKEVNDKDYDVAAIRRSGIQLVEVPQVG